uniref:Uncharacterized protein n=1 Tax=Magallana gigas TaxID=29159 RepID=K1P3J2_MAGGI
MIHPEYSINPGTPEDPPHVQTANDVAKNDPPPSYESLFGKIKRAKAESSGRVDFAKRSCSICTESVVFAVILCIILIIPVSMIVMGSVFLYDCRANEMVPVYLVVHGVFLIIAIIFGLLQTRSDKDKKKDSKKEKTPNEKCIELISTLIHAPLVEHLKKKFPIMLFPVNPDTELKLLSEKLDVGAMQLAELARTIFSKFTDAGNLEIIKMTIILRSFCHEKKLLKKLRGQEPVSLDFWVELKEHKERIDSDEDPLKWEKLQAREEKRIERYEKL